MLSLSVIISTIPLTLVIPILPLTIVVSRLPLTVVFIQYRLVCTSEGDGCPSESKPDSSVVKSVVGDRCYWCSVWTKCVPWPWPAASPMPRIHNITPTNKFTIVIVTENKQPHQNLAGSDRTPSCVGDSHERYTNVTLGKAFTRRTDIWDKSWSR